MAGERIKLEVQERPQLGSAAARRLRKEGFVPGVIYGHGQEPRAFAVSERELRRALTGAHGLHAILDVKLEGESKPRASVLKDYQRDRLRDRVTHIDLLEVSLDETIQSQVTIELTGESAGVKQGGVLSHALYMVSLEAKPLEIPERVAVDVSGLGLGDSLRVADLPQIEGVAYLDDPETVVASVTAPTEEIVEPAEGEGEAEGEAAAEAGDGVADEAAAPEAEAAGEPDSTEE